MGAVGPVDEGFGLKIRRSGLRFPSLAMCRSVGQNLIFRTPSVQPAIIGIRCTDPRLDQ